MFVGISQPKQEGKETPMSKPTHIAYVVNKPKDQPEHKGFWRPVGAVFQHKNGSGFDVVIHDQLAVSGRIVCTVPKEDKAGEDVEAE
jgi:hypothetical protein